MRIWIQEISLNADPDPGDLSWCGSGSRRSLLMRIRIQEISLNADPDYCENSKCDSATRTNACAHLCLLAPSLICLGAHDRPIFRVYCICRSCSVLMTRKRWAMWRWTLKWIMPHIQYTSIPVSLNPRWRPTNLVGGERGPSLIN